VVQPATIGKGLQNDASRAAYPVFLDLLAPRGQPAARRSCGAGSLLARRTRAHRAVGVDLVRRSRAPRERVAPTAEVAVGAGEALAFRSATFD